jgi:glycosyltransferase involved in cell wall biosynthesis
MSLTIAGWPACAEKATNPYTWLVYEPMAAMGVRVFDFSFYKPLPRTTNVLHVHWPEGIFWNRFSRTLPWLAGFFAKRLLLAIAGVRARGGCLVWTAHNLQPHEVLHPVHARIWRTAFAQFRRQVDLVICLSPEAGRLLRQRYPDLDGKPLAIIPHPHYRTAYPRPVPLPEARARLGLPADSFVLGCLGGIRPSKGIADFAEAFARIAQHDELLLIAGACDAGEYLTRLMALAEAHPRAIRLQIGRLSDADLVTTLSAVDLKVLNFRNILNSGSALLALSFDIPICTPAMGSLPELARAVGSDWVMELPQGAAPAQLRAVVDDARALSLKRRASRAPLPPLWEPQNVARLTLEAYLLALRQRRGQTAADRRKVIEWSGR